MIARASNTAMDMVRPLAEALANGGPIPKAPEAAPGIPADGSPPARNPLSTPATPSDVGDDPPVAVPNLPVVSEEPRAWAPPTATAPVQPGQPAPPVPVVSPVQFTPVPPITAGDVASRFSDEPTIPDTTIAIPEFPEMSVIPEALPEERDKAGHAFAALRTQVKDSQTVLTQAKGAITAFQTQLDTMGTENKDLTTQLTESAAKVEDLTNRLGKVSLAESPEFQAKYDVQSAALEQKLAQTLVQFTPLDPAQAAAEASRFLKMTPEELIAASDDYNPMVCATANLIGADLARIQEAKAQELGDWRQSVVANNMGNARQEIVLLTAQREQFAQEGIEAANARGNLVYGALDPEARQLGKELGSAFCGFAKNASEKALVAAAAEGFTVPFLQEALSQRDATIAQLSEQLGVRRNAAMPPIRSAHPTPVPVAPAQPVNTPGVAVANPSDSAAAYAVNSTAPVLAALNARLRR